MMDSPNNFFSNRTLVYVLVLLIFLVIITLCFYRSCSRDQTLDSSVSKQLQQIQKKIKKVDSLLIVTNSKEQHLIQIIDSLKRNQQKLENNLSLLKNQIKFYEGKNYNIYTNDSIIKYLHRYFGDTSTSY